MNLKKCITSESIEPQHEHCENKVVNITNLFVSTVATL